MPARACGAAARGARPWETAMDVIKADIAIVGAGGGGLRAAIAAAERDPTLSIVLLSKV